MSKESTALALTMLVAFVLLAGRAEGQVYVNRGRSPDTLGELITRTDAVIVGKVVGLAVFVPDPSAPPVRHTYTKYRILVTEVIKTDAHVGSAGAMVDVVQIGTGPGTTEPGLEILFGEGTELALVISRWPSQGVYSLHYGPEGVFELKKGAVRPRGESPLASSLGKQTREKFLAALRAAAR